MFFIFLGTYLSEFSEFQESFIHLRLLGRGGDEAKATFDDDAIFLSFHTRWARVKFSLGSLSDLTLLAERLSGAATRQRKTSPWY